jgi:hypothetical protein
VPDNVAEDSSRVCVTRKRRERHKVEPEERLGGTATAGARHARPALRALARAERMASAA